MKKIVSLSLLLLSIIMIQTGTTNKPSKVFIERSQQGAFVADSNLSNDTAYEEDKLVMSVVLGYEAFSYQENLEMLDRDTYIEVSRNYHLSMNHYYEQMIDIESNDIFISEYTPYIYYYFEDETMVNLYSAAVNIAEASYINSVYLYDDSLYKSEGTEIELDYQSQTMQSALSTDLRQYTYDNFPMGTVYTGNGIKIGILDTGVFNPNHSNFSDNYAEITYDTYTSNNSAATANHPTWVASILGGKYGIANKASLYYVDVNSQSGFTAVERLINKGVHVINMSIANKSYYNDGTYDSSQEAYLDYIYTSTKVVMIAAAGNSLNVEGANGYISLPALSSNVIAVGSVNNSGVMSSFSSYKNKNDIRSKPSLVALGENRNIFSVGSKSGTSFSASAVTGAVALFFEKRGVRDMPITLAVLTATANNASVSKNVATITLKTYHASSDSYTNSSNTVTATNYERASGLFERSGAGQLDITKLLEYNQPFPGEMTLTNTNYVTLNSQIYLQAGQTITASLAWQRNASKQTNWFFWTTYTSAALADLDIAIFNTSDVIQKKISSTATNNEVLRFTATVSGNYQLKFKPYTNYLDLRRINYAYMIN